MHFRLLQNPRGETSFQLILDSGAVALVSPEYRDRDVCLKKIEETVDGLRERDDTRVDAVEGGFGFVVNDELGAKLATSDAREQRAEAEELLRELRRWAAAGESFKVRHPITRSRSRGRTVLVNVALRYDLEQRSRSGVAGAEAVQRARDGLFCAHYNDERGQPLLFTRGVVAKYPRDELLRSLLRALADKRRYTKRESSGRWYFVITARNGRELARSRWFDSLAERDAAITWIISSAPQEERRYLGKRTRRKTAKAGYDLERPSRSGEAGFEVFFVEEGGKKRHYFHFNDEGGAALLYSHGYGSTR